MMIAFIIKTINTATTIAYSHSLCVTVVTVAGGPRGKFDIASEIGEQARYFRATWGSMDIECHHAMSTQPPFTLAPLTSRHSCDMIAHMTPAPIFQSDDLVTELIAAPKPDVLAPRTPGPQKIRYTHDAMIDILVENPWVSQNQLAAHFGYSPAWVSTVMATDMFRARLATRRDELIDPEIRATLEERFRATVETSLRRLQEKLSAPNPPDNLILRAVELGAKALGFGQLPPPSPPAESQTTERLARIAERLLNFQSQARISHVIEAPLAEVIEAREAPIHLEVRPQPVERSFSDGDEERADEPQPLGGREGGDWRQVTGRR